MLIYHPMKDPFNCIYRMLCILQDIELSVISSDLIKILDFYIVFPHLLKDIKLPSNLSKHRKIFNNIKKPYENLPDARQLMFDISVIQDQVINSMIAKGVFVKDDFLHGNIKLHEFYIENTDIKDILVKAKFREEEWYNILINDLSKIPLLGADGLKNRTGLMEYRYDNA